MPTSSLSLNIISRDNNSGLTNDVAIIMDALQGEAINISWYTVGKPHLRHKLRRVSTSLEQWFSQRLRQQPRYDVNLFLEDVVPRWLPFARVNLLIPNQEWFRETWSPYLSQFDYILCKTRLAEEIFKPWGRTYYIGFTSRDRCDRRVTPDYDRAFHLSGPSPRLQTQLLLKLWSQRPDFPPLTLISQTIKPSESLPENLHLVSEFIPDNTLPSLQTQHGVHIYPSRCEGFGHRLMEGMSCQAVLVTSDGPPMNELVTPERGVLVPYHKSEPQHWGQQYFVSLETLTTYLEKLWGTDLATRRAWGEHARQYYEESDRAFRKRLPELLRNL